MRTLVTDLDVLNRNLVTLSVHCQSLGNPFHVHTKSHKMPKSARRQFVSDETKQAVVRIPAPRRNIVDGERTTFASYPVFELRR